ncbi:MAG: acyl-CoA carboxylase subunit epsilon [Nocardioidaceae bacterium]
MSGQEAEPLLVQVINGDPTPEELAALVTVVAARSAAAAGDEQTGVRRSGWTARERLVRGTHHHGTGTLASQRPPELRP